MCLFDCFSSYGRLGIIMVVYSFIYLFRGDPPPLKQGRRIGETYSRRSDDDESDGDDDDAIQ